MAFDLTKVKANFFDRAVTDALDPAVKKALSKFGAYVRTRAKSSIRKRKKPSPPGQPPSSHTGLLKKLIFFAYDPGRQSVVIGPTLGGSQSGAPEALEKGGPSTLRERVGGKTVTRAVQIRPRPYMKPAFDVELGKVAGDFKSLIGK